MTTASSGSVSKNRKSSHGELDFRRDFVGDIPVLICTQKNDVPKPLVILSHGFTGNKGFWIPYLRTLGENGFFAVALDNRGHGAWSGASFHDQAFLGDRLRLDVLRRLIKETADDIPLLIDHFLKLPGVAGDRIAMAGVSMGGFATFRAMIVDDRITVGAPIIASPYWDDLPRDVRIVEDSASSQALDDLDCAYSPARFPEKFSPRPLLIQIGGLDGHYDGKRVMAFGQLLHADYDTEDAETLRVIVHAGVGHEFTPAMWNEALAWIRRFTSPLES
jgi:uncharacterized protein